MSETKNIRLIMQYEGANYHGWQRQKDEVTIQELVEDKLRIMTGRPVAVYASGRTDSGVHALHQVCNFLTETKIPPESIKNGLNSLLPNDIYISKAEYAEPGFHSRYSAKSKSYEYRILNTRDIDIFLSRYVWHIKDDLNFDEIRKCLSLLTGKHDFTAFRSSGTSNVNPVREIFRAELTETHEDGTVRFYFEAEGFLKHMVRNIVGTIVDAGKGKITSREFQEIIESKDRKRAGCKAPPQGLFLTMVKY